MFCLYVAISSPPLPHSLSPQSSQFSRKTLAGTLLPFLTLRARTGERQVVVGQHIHLCRKKNKSTNSHKANIYGELTLCWAFRHTLHSLPRQHTLWSRDCYFSVLQMRKQSRCVREPGRETLKVKARKRTGANDHLTPGQETCRPWILLHQWFPRRTGVCNHSSLCKRLKKRIFYLLLLPALRPAWQTLIANLNTILAMTYLT